jgi:hypothetical protein
MWALAIEDKRTGRVRVFDRVDIYIAADDPDFGDGHAVPIYGDDTTMSFGAHEFTRQCYCHPTIKIEPDKRTLEHL